MDVYHLTVTAMRALRLFALVIGIVMVGTWGPALVRLFRQRPVIVPAIVRGDLTEERERNRAMFAMIAGGVCLFQLGFLAPLPDLTQARIWMVGLLIVTAAMLWAIYHHNGQDDRFRPRRTALNHVAIFALCVVFAVATR